MSFIQYNGSATIKPDVDISQPCGTIITIEWPHGAYIRTAQSLDRDSSLDLLRLSCFVLGTYKDRIYFHLIPFPRVTASFILLDQDHPWGHVI
ncbi:predicted protein [Botrytis cinerea T4]|uniref:Uncharacterized protein n=1 Tax=Botryotinia fuckeliana (strain T4) TaxID=999810 RepID=G2Y1C0_BOTF4|nr:predicted protein [Botrytis cinerea T4]